MIFIVANDGVQPFAPTVHRKVVFCEIPETDVLGFDASKKIAVPVSTVHRPVKPGGTGLAANVVERAHPINWSTPAVVDGTTAVFEITNCSKSPVQPT